MRYFYEEHITQGIMPLSQESSRHITQVLRMKVGDQFILTDGKGTKATVQISTTGKRDCSVEVLKQEVIENLNPDVHLAISFTKNSARMEWLLEKITEIGVRSIYPLQASRNEKKEFKADRFQKKLISAMLQSQQCYLPVLHSQIPFSEMLTLDFGTKLIAHCENQIERKPLKLSRQTLNDSQLVAIGPEGDFTIEEIEQAIQQNFKSVSLGNNRLRTETAGLVAVTLLHHDAQ